MVTKINKTIYRGNNEILTWKLDGDYTNKTFTLIAKASRDFKDDRLIEVDVNTLFDTMQTIFVAEINGELTQNLSYKKIYYDIIDNNQNAIITGELKIDFDVATPFDGFDISDNTYIYKTVRAEDGGINDILLTDNNGNFQFYSLEQLKQMLNALP